MISVSSPIFILYLSLVGVSLVHAQVAPTTPGPNETYTAGSDCRIAWDPDTTGSWTNMTIDLMSGSNDAMSKVTNVATGIDGTDNTLTPFNWTCPEVNPYSAIYFYQFSNNGNKSTSEWTTRFTITSPSGDTTPPAHDEQPNGDAVPWGNGRLVVANGSKTVDSTPANSPTFLSSHETLGLPEAPTPTELSLPALRTNPAESAALARASGTGISRPSGFATVVAASLQRLPPTAAANIVSNDVRAAMKFPDRGYVAAASLFCLVAIYL